MKFKLIILLAIAFSFSCKKEKGTAIPAQGVLTTGTWYVSKMTEDGDDLTYLFDEYTFVFNTNGELTAACPYGTEVGSWYAEADDDDDDEFRIALGNTEPLVHLSKRWHIRSQVADKVELYDDDNDEEEVTFTKQ
ncbi:MAG: hypothetical protein KBF92_08145 [Bacteroidia bacterium]|nr:hypothetical protein [Bacteroidia bacterium]